MRTVLGELMSCSHMCINCFESLFKSKLARGCLTVRHLVRLMESARLALRISLVPDYSAKANECSAMFVVKGVFPGLKATACVD